jgi:hypothetical protein
VASDDPKAGRLIRPVVPAPLAPEDVDKPVTPELAAQTALAVLLRNPERPLLTELSSRYSEQGFEFQATALQRARDLVGHVVGTTLRPGAKGESVPTLLDRLNFAWRIVRQADVAIWRLKKADVPQRPTLTFAKEVFAPLLPALIEDPLAVAILEVLRLEGDARFLPHYWAFRRAKTQRPEDLAAPLSHAIREDNAENFRRVIWWIIRARREEYVELRAGGPVRIEFAFLVDAVLADLMLWYGPELQDTDQVAPDVEAEINQWLT